MDSFYKYQNLVNFCISVCFVSLLIGCKSPDSTENLEPDRFAFIAYVNYFPATGEAYVSIDIEYDAFLSSTSFISLGNGDTFFISSGDNITTITGSTLSAPMIIDPASELSVEFQRNGESLKKYTVNIAASLFPSIESDVSNLNANARQLSASLDYGIALPYEIETGLRFGYGSMPVRCYGEDTGFEELRAQSLLSGGFASPEIFVPSPLDEATLNPQSNANALVATQYQNLLTSELYEYCEHHIYSFVDIDKPFNSETSGQTYVSEYVSYFEEGGFDGSLSIRLVSEPIDLRINRTALLP